MGSIPTVPAILEWKDQLESDKRQRWCVNDLSGVMTAHPQIMDNDIDRYQ